MNYQFITLRFSNEQITPLHGTYHTDKTEITECK